MMSWIEGNVIYIGNMEIFCNGYVKIIFYLKGLCEDGGCVVCYLFNIEMNVNYEYWYFWENDLFFFEVFIGVS